MAPSDWPLEDLLSLGTSTLYEASGLSIALDPALRPAWPGAAVAGPAFPVTCAPGDNLAIHVGMDAIPAGHILVVDAAGFVAGYWGEVLTVAALARGVTGLIIDGGVRDVAALESRRFPVFTRGISMRGTTKVSAPSVGVPITLGGVRIAPNDLIVADGDGVIAIPEHEVGRVLAAARIRAEKERDFMRRLEAGETTLELLGLTSYRWRPVSGGTVTDN